MKTRKKILSIAIISLVLMMNLLQVFSYEKSRIPEYIKIGLFFDRTAKAMVAIESPEGIEAGIFYGEEYVPLFELKEKKIVLKKDVENGLGEGSYHIQIGQDFSSYREAEGFLSTIESIIRDGYLCYEGGWKVFVGIYSDENSAEENARQIRSYGYAAKPVMPSSTRVQVVDDYGNPIFMYDSSQDIYFAGRNRGVSVPIITVEGNKYRGAVTAKRLSNSDMTIINKLPLQEYLYGVVPAEMPAAWPMEALKAQAVSARVFTLSNLNKYQQFDFNLCATTNSQVYKGYSGEHPNTNRAVDETRSTIVTYQGNLIETFYHSNSGGYTESSENVWSAALPYARGIKDDFSLNELHSTWEVSFTKEDIKRQLASNNIFIGDIVDMKITSTSESGRVLSLVIYGTTGQETLEKQRSRTVLGLKSNYFFIDSNGFEKENGVAAINSSGIIFDNIALKNKKVVTASGVYNVGDSNNLYISNGRELQEIKDTSVVRASSDDFTIFGRGYGHGIGMSQYGAKKMGELGYSFEEILQHYYTGVKVE
ncbi:SpoIID/LytB domain-containing protein [Alkaliphilus oremlandii]|uniref:SpoIID/LytB domain n=1 Tax=Alkaliphilus oremlandii (strain OhILAs) TaxID=350688 RepID=A8MGP1_ALKOO|nr:SpoIID/LytB domain-containing protein [Alkaliphilus oremlandii]ABW19264.1 SpoIID/LytB domain [Alkaliphilus oremlandii OhILAs]